MTERTVDLVGPANAEDAKKVCSIQGSTRLDDIASSVPKFKTTSYDTFKAEYNENDGTIVVHFFLPKRKVTERYWKVLFAEALNEIGQEHFQATAPRLTAKYTEELHSWWFRAQGYAHIIDLELFLGSFFSKLDARMDPSLQTQSKTS